MHIHTYTYSIAIHITYDRVSKMNTISKDRIMLKELTEEITFILTLQEGRAGEEVNKKDISREELLKRLLSKIQRISTI